MHFQAHQRWMKFRGGEKCVLVFTCIDPVVSVVQAVRVTRSYCSQPLHYFFYTLCSACYVPHSATLRFLSVHAPLVTYPAISICERHCECCSLLRLYRVCCLDSAYYPCEFHKAFDAQPRCRGIALLDTRGGHNGLNALYRRGCCFGYCSATPLLSVRSRAHQ